jgi:hemerythrin-like metal-binding protein
MNHNGKGSGMDFFQWKDSFNIGHLLIDRQHKSFMNILNDYHEALSNGKIEQTGKYLAKELKIYSAMHFRIEEDLMKTVGYEETSKHLKQHRHFESLVSDFERDHTEKKDKSVKKMLLFMRDWFLTHILEQDKRMIPYLD